MAGKTTSFPARRWLLLLHRWIGVALAIPLLVVVLSGAALAWREPLDRLVHPGRYAVTGSQLLPLDAYAARLHPGDRIAGLTLPTGSGPVVAITASGGALYLDPPSARILGAAPASSLRFLSYLHVSLLAGAWGRIAVALLGLALLVASLSGLWLWRPTVGGWAHGLRWRRRPGRSANLHHLLGLLTALPLGWLALSGSWLSLQSAPPPPDHARPLSRPGLSAQEAVRRALAVAPGPIRDLTWPTERTPDWRVRLAACTVSVADDSPIPIAVADGAAAPEHTGKLHAGQGPIARALIALTGLAAAALTLTGLAMWRRGGSA